jgi:hypothetical protein
MSIERKMKEIPWPGDACIVCLKQAGLSLEHVIPESLHGSLTCKFLCVDCNSFFGHTVDAAAKSDPTIRMAARALENVTPELIGSIEEGQRYIFETDVVSLYCLKRDGQFQGIWHDMPDGSSIVPEDLALGSLRGRMRREGLSSDEIEEAIARYRTAEPGDTVKMSQTWSAKKLSAYLAGPDLRAPRADPLLFVKIAYEFTALLVGSAIYARSPQLDELRDVLRNLKRDSDAFHVEALLAKEARAFHGIAFEGNTPHAVFQIRLFGKSAYRVQFRRLAVDYEPIAYTNNLESGEHWHNLGDVVEDMR